MTCTFTPTDPTHCNSATYTQDINVVHGFQPDPNGYRFPDFRNKIPLPWDGFKATYPVEITEPKYESASPDHKNFYKNFFTNMGLGENCFGMASTSLLTYNNGVKNEFTAVSDQNKAVLREWLKIPQAFLILNGRPILLLATGTLNIKQYK